MLSEQRLSERDKSQLIKKERCFKCYEFEYLIMNYIVKKQNVSNVIKKNNIKSIIIRKKINKRCRSSSINNNDDLEN